MHKHAIRDATGSQSVSQFDEATIDVFPMVNRLRLRFLRGANFAFPRAARAKPLHPILNLDATMYHEQSEAEANATPHQNLARVLLHCTIFAAGVSALCPVEQTTVIIRVEPLLVGKQEAIEVRLGMTQHALTEYNAQSHVFLRASRSVSVPTSNEIPECQITTHSRVAAMRFTLYRKLPRDEPWRTERTTHRLADDGRPRPLLRAANNNFLRDQPLHAALSERHFAKLAR
jgi:hypothetical protein